jgi:hypothetical protein
VLVGASGWVGLPSRLKRSIDNWDLLDLKNEGIERKLCDERSRLSENGNHEGCRIESDGEAVRPPERL